MKQLSLPLPVWLTVPVFCLLASPAVLPAEPVEWTGGGDGSSWADPLNWSTGAVPGATSEVVVPEAFAGTTVVIPGGTRVITSLTAAGGLTLSSGSLTINGDAQIGGGLTLANNTTLVLQGSGSVLTVAGSVSAGDASVRAIDGAVIDFSGLASLARSANGNRQWEARGAGSVIDLSGLQTLAGRSYISSGITFLARQGGQIRMDTLPSASSTIHFDAQDSGSRIDLPALTTFSGYMWGSVAGFTAKTGGTIDAPLLTSVGTANLVIDATGSMDLAQIGTWSGGTLIIDVPGIAFDSLTALTNARLELRGQVPALPLLANIDSSSVIVTSGAVLNLPLVAAYKNDSNESRELSASGAGSRLELPNLLTLRGYSYISRNTDILAVGGGVIDFPALTTVTDGAVWFKADGAGSRVQLPLLSSFNGYFWGTRSGFGAVNGGVLVTGSLVSVVEADLVIDATGSIDIAQIATWNTGTLVIELPGLEFSSLAALTNARLELRGQVPALPLLANIDSSSIVITGGVTLNLPLVAAYKNDSNESREFRVSGAGSRLELPNLLTMRGYSYISRNTDMLAVGGGVIDFPALTAVTDGAVWFKADGAGSRIQLPQLSSFNGYFWGTRSGFSAVNGGVLVTGSLVNVIDADFVVDATGAMDIAQIATWHTGTLVVDRPGVAYNSLTALTNARLELRGEVPALPVLSNINGSSLVVSGGAVLELPLVTSYTNNVNETREIIASGEGSLIRFPALTSITGYSYISRNTTFTASGGGTLEFPELAEVPGGAVFFRSTGAGSLVDLPRLASFKGYFWGTLSGFEAVNEGTLHLATELTRMSARTATVTVMDTAVFTVPEIELLTEATLLGNGVLTGDVVVTSGAINPGNTLGLLTIDGDVEMGQGGRLVFEIGGLTPATQHDQLLVLGHLQLNGTLQTTLVNSFAPAIDDAFTLAEWGTRDGAFLDYAGLDAGASTEFVPEIGDEVLVVFAQFASGPQVIDVQPAGFAELELASFTVTFSEPIAASSFAVADVGFTGPSGAIPVTRVRRLAAERFAIEFAAQYDEGDYTLELLTGILDNAGNPMNQDGDETNGEPAEDGYLHTVTLSASLLPDLVVGSIDAPATATAGQPVTLSWTISNLRENPTATGWTDAVYLADNVAGANAYLVGTFPSSEPIAANDSVIRSVEIILPASKGGLRHVVVVTDYTNVIPELAGELNNQLVDAEPVEILAPDLVVTGATAGLQQALWGGQVTVSWTIANTGTAPSNNTWRDRIYLVDTVSQARLALLGTADAAPVAPLTPGATAPMAATVALPRPALLPDGDYAILVEADGWNAQPESVESNNTASAGLISIASPALPDLSISGLTGPVAAESGAPVTVNWTLHNNGTAVATLPLHTRLYVSSSGALGGAVPLGIHDEPAELGAGDNRPVNATFTMPANAPNGPVYLLAVADYDNRIVESNEANNTAVSAATVGIPARLTLAIEPASFPENAGNRAATAWLTRNGPTSAALNVALASSDTTEATVPESVVIPRGQSAVSFAVAAVIDGQVDGPQTATVSATASGFPDATADVTVTNIDEPMLALSIGAASLPEGESTPATVLLPQAATAAVTVFLTSSSPTHVLIPNSVVIPSGQDRFTFSVVARQNGTPQTDRFISIQADADDFGSAGATLEIVDDDLDSLDATLSRSSVAENDGAAAAVLTLTRFPVTSAAVRVQLDSDSGRIGVPASVLIPAGQASVDVNVAAIDNNELDGDATVSVGARVTDPDHGGLVLAAPRSGLTVVDDDGPALALSLSASLAGEGVQGAAVLTITRNDGFDTALEVSLSSSDTGEAALPASATIPAGAPSVEVPVDTVEDGETDGTQTVLFTATAAGFAQDSIEFTVTDDDLPDLVITGLSVQAEGQTEKLFSLSYTLVNQGSVDIPVGFTQHVFLSDDPYAGDDIFLGAITLGSGLPAGEGFTRSVSYYAPRVVGPYWVVVKADAPGEIAEILENNNTAVSPEPVDVISAYTASISTDVTSAPAGTPIPLRGSAVTRSGAPAPNVIVSIHLKVRDTHRVFAAITNAVGEFSTTFYPLPSEGGQYTLGAAHPGESDAPGQDYFQILGILPEPEVSSVELIAGAGDSLLTVELNNLADVALTGLSVGSVELPAGLQLSTWIGDSASPVDQLPALGSVTLGIQLSATEEAAGTRRLLVPLATAEGVAINIPVDVTVKKLLPKLVADVGRLYATLVGGEGKIASFTLSNTGGAPSGPVTMSLPGSLPWIQPVNGAQLPSLAPGASMTVGFTLAPPENLQLGEYAGTIGFNAQGSSLSLPFSILNLSDATGDLVVFTEDELTYYAEGAPRVAGARIALRDYFSGELAAEADANASGFASFTGITEGYYELEVSAENHRTFRETILVEAGILNEVTAFLPYQSITYNFTVVPTTIQDRYKIVVETVFETNLPIPVVTVDPAYIDLDELTAPVTQIDFTLTNHGLLAAENTTFSFNAPGGWTIEPLIEKIGTMPAKSSITIPVIITNLAMAAQGMALPQAGGCGGGSVKWTVDCGDGSKGGSSPVVVSGGGGDCRGSLGGGGGGGSGGGGRVKIAGGKGDCTPGSAEGPPCVPKTLILCGVGMIPIPGACIPGVLDCIVNFDDSKPITSGVGCVLSGVGCIPGLNVPANLLLCAASLALCGSNEGAGTASLAAYAGTIAGGDAFALPMGSAVQSDMQFYLEELARYQDLAQAVLDYHVLLFGTDAWFNGLLGSDFADWNARLQAAVSESGDSGAHISAGERAGLIAGPLPEGITGGQVAAFIDRWENGLTYAEQGVFRAADLPQGWDPGFLPFLDLQDAALLASAAYAEAQADGFVDPWEGLIHYRDLAMANLGTNLPVLAAANDAIALPAEAGGVCARVRLRIEQEAVLARDAFDAHLEIINETDSAMEGIEVALLVTDEAGNDATHLFQLRPPQLGNLSGVDGTGFLESGVTGSARWIIVPAPDAAPAAQTRYLVSGYLRYRYDGLAVNVPLEEVGIDVLPTPRLSLKYFHQRDVFSDDPFTDVVEPSIPFSLGIIVENSGAGTARDFTITSSQPKIVDNEKGLLVDFQIVATQVDGQPLLPSLTAAFGDIPPGGRSVGQWLMTSTIQGLFIEYSATFEHVDAFGDPRLSLIDSVDIVEMIRPVDGDGDSLSDFLVNELPDDNDFPDTLYLGGGGVFRVSVSTVGAAVRAPQENSLAVGFTADMDPGWCYLRVPDPAAGGFILARIVRPDGSEVPSANFWQTDRTFIGEGRPPVREDMLHILDVDSGGEYTLVYALPPTADGAPPVSTVNPLPPASPEVFTVSWSGSDDTGVRDYSVYVSADSGPFIPWLLETRSTTAIFTGAPGTRYAFFSIARDNAGNEEDSPPSADAVTVTSLVNRAPEIGALPDRSISEGDLLELTVVAADPDDGDSVSLTLAGDYPVGMTLDPVSGRLAWQSGEIHGGQSWTVQVSATDNGVPSASAAASFTLTVLEGSEAPLVAAPLPRQISTGRTLFVAIEAEDYDLPAQQLLYSLGQDSPAGAHIDPATGLFTWTPSLAHYGNNELIVLVSDGENTTPVVLPVLVTLPELYSAWKDLYWPDESDLGIIGYAADPEGDGIFNLEEYARGHDPLEPSPDPTPLFELVVEDPADGTGDSSFHVQVEYVCRIDDPRLLVEVVAADDLAAPDAQWDVIPDIVSTSDDGLPIGFRRFIVRDPLDSSVHERRFVRLRYSFD